jgi:uncharacterized protein (TIGR00645 family)
MMVFSRGKMFEALKLIGAIFNVSSKAVGNFLSSCMLSSRWLLFPINAGLIAALVMYIVAFLKNDYHFIMSGHADMEHLMVSLLGLVDAAMVANLIIMIAQGGHQVFIQKLDLDDKKFTPQYLDHIDTGILKIKVALSIACITLVQMLKDFVNLQNLQWELVKNRMIMHVVILLSAFVVAIIWRITHPAKK